MASGVVNLFTMSRRRAWQKWWATEKRKVRPTSIQLPAEYLDSFVEIHDDVVIFVGPSMAALLTGPGGLRDVVGKNLTQFALCWAEDERAMSEFSDMASGSRDRCRTPSAVSGKQLEWTALRSRERAGRCVLLATVREHQERTALGAGLASYEKKSSANENVGTIGSQADQCILDNTSDVKVVPENFTNILLETNAFTQEDNLGKKRLPIVHHTSPKTSFARPVLGPSLYSPPPVVGRRVSAPILGRHLTGGFKGVLKRMEDAGSVSSLRGSGFEQSFQWEDNSVMETKKRG